MDISYLLDYNQIPRGQKSKVHLLVVLETWPDEKGKERKPLNLCLVLDRSGSMEGAKLEATKEAASLLVQKLQAKDIISLVAYDSQVEVLVPPTSGSQKADIFRQINRLDARGCTNLSGGWIRGLSLVLEKASPEYINRVLLLTDGLANEGVTDLAGLTEMGRQFLEKKISTTTLGFGTDFNEEHLMEIASTSGGRFFYISGAEAAPSVFMSEFGDLIKVVGQNLKVHLESLSSLPRPTLCGALSHSIKGNGLVIDLGDLLEEDRRQVLAQIEIPAHLPEGLQDILHIQVTYDSVRGIIGPRAHSLEATVEVSQTLQKLSSPNEVVEREIVFYRLGEAKLAAARLEEGGDFIGAAKVLEKISEYLSAKGYLDGDNFKKEREELANLAKDLLSLKINRSNFRKTLKSSSYSQTIQIGTFKQRPNVFVDSFVVTPSTAERIYDILDKIRAVLLSFDHLQEFVNKAEFIFRELMDNAMEHGCKDRPDGAIEGEIRISKHYFKSVITDHGPGFDFVSVLLKQREKSPEKGLLAIEKLGALLHFNPEGNSVAATLSTQGFTLNREGHPFLKDGLVGEVIVIRIQGNLDNMTHYRLEEEVRQAIDEGNTLLVVDMAGVQYISSSGISALIYGAELCKKSQGRFLLVGLKNNVKNIIELLGLLDFFEMAPSLDEALRRLS